MTSIENVMPRYKELWENPEKPEYRMAAYNRQNLETGSKPLLDNPNFNTIKTRIKLYNPSRVLEVGCGWGRILSQLQSESYEVWGCDVSSDMLNICLAAKLKAFPMDLTSSTLNGYSRWDVVFSRGVLHYLLESDEMIHQVVKNLELFTLRKCILWEYQETCDAVKKFMSPKLNLFDFQPIERKDE